jgi:uncharacterized protein (TIGR02391 family)
MSARDIGFMILPVLSQQQRRAFIPNEFVQFIGDKYVPRDMGAEALFLEGIGYLENIGYLAEAMSLSAPVRMLTVTRAGQAAASADLGDRGSHAARGLPLTELLHPTIAAEALPEVDRGPDYFQDAIFKAYRAVETAVRDAAIFGNDKIGVQLMQAAFGQNGPLRDSKAEAGEADAVRNLFAGAIGTIKNPSSHRIIDERDPRQAMRLLVFASLLLEIVDRRAQIE